MQVEVRNGDANKWVQLNLISNKEPTEEEFKRFSWARNQCRDTPYTLEKVKLKQIQIEEAEKFKYNPEEVEQQVKNNLYKKLREGNLKGFNLTYVRIELETEIEVYKNKLKTENNEGIRQKIQSFIIDLEESLSKVEQARIEYNQNSSNFLKTEDQGQTKVLKIEDLEKQMQEEEWFKLQEYQRKHPEQKKNNIFMKLIREDSAKTVNKQESEKKSLQKELELLRRRSQANYEEQKNETYYQQVERRKRELTQFSQTTKFSFEEDLHIKQADGTVKVQFKP